MTPKKKGDVELPSTLERSPQKAQDTYADTLRSAEQEYGDGARTHRTAWGAVKHSFEKTGDHWEPKEDGRKGPSDGQSELSGDAARRGAGHSAHGVDEHASKAHLLELARAAEVRGRSTMTKAELVEALQKANDRATRAARS